MQLAAWGVTGWTVLGTLSALLQMLIVIVLRAHWTFDVLAGLFAAVLAGLLFWPA